MSSVQSFRIKKKELPARGRMMQAFASVERSTDEEAFAMKEGYRIKRQALQGRGQMMKFFEKSVEQENLQEQEREAERNAEWENLDFQQQELYSTSAWLNNLSFDQMKHHAHKLGRAYAGLGDDDSEDEQPGFRRYRSLSDAQRRTKFMKRVTVVVHRLLDGKLGINLRTNISAEQIGSPWSPSSCSFPNYDDDDGAGGVVVIGFSTPAARACGWQLFDEVVAVNGEPVPDRDAFAQAYSKAKESLPIHFAVLRRFGPEMRSIDAESNLELAQAKMQRLLTHEEDPHLGELDADRILEPFDFDEFELDRLHNPDRPGFEKADFKHRKCQLETTAEMTHELLHQNLALTEELKKCRGHLADFEYWLLRRQRKRNRRQSELPIPGDDFWPWEPQGGAEEAVAKDTTTAMPMEDVLEEAQRMFRILDGDGSGTVDRVELIKGLVNSPFVRAFFGLPEQIQEDDIEVLRRVQTIFRSIDKDKSSSLTWPEVKRWIMENPENAQNIAKAIPKRVAISAAPDEEEYIHLSSQQETPLIGLGNSGIQDSPNVQGGWRSDHMIAVPAQVRTGQTEPGSWEAQRAIAEDRITELFEALDTNNNQKLTIKEMFKLALLMEYTGSESDFEKEFQELCIVNRCEASDGLDPPTFRNIISDPNGQFYCDDEALDEFISKLVRAVRTQNLFKLVNLSDSGRLSQAELFMFVQEMGWKAPIMNFTSIFESVCEEAGTEPAEGIDEEAFSILVDDCSYDFYCDDDTLSGLLLSLHKKRKEMERMGETNDDTIDEGADAVQPKMEKSFSGMGKTPSGMEKTPSGRKAARMSRVPSSRGMSKVPSSKGISAKQAPAENSWSELNSMNSDHFDKIMSPGQEQRDALQPDQRVADAQRRRTLQSPSAEERRDATAHRRSTLSSITEASADKASKRMSRLQANAAALKAGSPINSLSSTPVLSSPRGLLGERPDTPDRASPRPEQPTLSSPATSAPRSSYSPMSVGRRSPELDPGMAFSGGGLRPGTIREGAHEEDNEDHSDHEHIILEGTSAPDTPNLQRIPSESRRAAQTPDIDRVASERINAESKKAVRMSPLKSQGSAESISHAKSSVPKGSSKQQTSDRMGSSKSAAPRTHALEEKEKKKKDLSARAAEAKLKLQKSERNTAATGAPNAGLEPKQRTPEKTLPAAEDAATADPSFRAQSSEKTDSPAPVPAQAEPTFRAQASERMAPKDSLHRRKVDKRREVQAAPGQSAFQEMPSKQMQKMPSQKVQKVISSRMEQAPSSSQGSAPAVEKPKPQRSMPQTEWSETGSVAIKSTAAFGIGRNNKFSKMSSEKFRNYIETGSMEQAAEPIVVSRNADGEKDLGVVTFDAPGQDTKSISPQVALRQPLGEERNPDLGDLIG